MVRFAERYPWPMTIMLCAVLAFPLSLHFVFPSSAEAAHDAHLRVSATLDFPNVVAGGQQELTITVQGAETGDYVVFAAPAGLEAQLSPSARVSAANTVTIRICNVALLAGVNPASATWNVLVAR